MGGKENKPLIEGHGRYLAKSLDPALFCDHPCPVQLSQHEHRFSFAPRVVQEVDLAPFSNARERWRRRSRFCFAEKNAYKVIASLTGQTARKIRLLKLFSWFQAAWIHFLASH